MKNKIAYICVLSVFFLLIVNSCKKEEITIEVSDVVISLNEYVAGGTLENNAIIGAVEAITNEGSVRFSMLEQTPDGAIKVNAISGLITVVNRNLFDFELNETLITKVKVENGDVSKEISITINLIDITSDNIYLTVTPEYVITMDENPQTDLITDINATSNGGQVDLAFIEQVPNNAFQLQDHQLLVSDISLFDFEANTTMTAIIRASIGELSEDISVIITLNNQSPEFSRPEVILENITAGELDFKGNLLYFIDDYSGYKGNIVSLNINNPSEGIVAVTGSGDISYMSIFEDDIYFTSNNYFKKYNIADESVVDVSEFGSYWDDFYGGWYYKTPEDLLCAIDNIFFTYGRATSNFTWDVIERLNIADGLFYPVSGDKITSFQTGFYLSDNFLYWIRGWSDGTSYYTIKRLDLNSIESPNLLIENVTNTLSSVGHIFINEQFMYLAGGTSISQFNLTNIPSVKVQDFEFVDIYFGSVKLIGDTLYFADYANHTLSKIEINFDE